MTNFNFVTRTFINCGNPKNNYPIEFTFPEEYETLPTKDLISKYKKGDEDALCAICVKECIRRTILKYASKYGNMTCYLCDQDDLAIAAMYAVATYALKWDEDYAPALDEKKEYKVDGNNPEAYLCQQIIFAIKNEARCWQVYANSRDDEDDEEDDIKTLISQYVDLDNNAAS